MSAQPQLTELLDTLEELPPHEVRYVCATLGVDQPTLDKIDADHRDALTRIPKYLQSWLDCDSHTSWTRIVEILKSKRLNKTVLANKIMKRYCQTASACSTAATVVPSSKARSTCSSSSHEVSSSSDSSSLEFEPMPLPAIDPSPLPQMPITHCTEGTSSDQRELSPTTLPVVPLSKPERRLLKHIAKTASDLEMQFLSVINSANAYLAKQMEPEKFQVFKTDLTRLPLSGRYMKLRFLRDKKQEIKKAQSVEDVFDILDHYWNYVDYSLLEHIVKTYCNKSVKRQMKRYKCDLEKFERATSVKDFTLALPNNRKFPLELSTLSADLKIDAAQCTLHHVRKIMKAIAQKASLQRYVVYMRDLHASFVVMTIAFPQAAREFVEQVLQKKFLKRLSVIPESVRIDGLIPHSVLSFLESSPHHMSPAEEEQGEDNDSAMPDPPSNIREELTHAIKITDLKPEYRWIDGRRRIKNYCSLIESRTQASIQLHWRLALVKFHIAGLEDDVVRAVLLIREEFETSSSADESFSVKGKGFQSQPPTVLTEKALQEHEALTSQEVRQFSCIACGQDWWRVVPAGKPVSRCSRCNTRYNALPRRKEYGMGRFTCPNETCGLVFNRPCHAYSIYRCPDCKVIVMGPYILHKDDNRPPSMGSMVSYSRPHISSGSTVDTWLSQTAAATGGSQAAAIGGSLAAAQGGSLAAAQGGSLDAATGGSLAAAEGGSDITDTLAAAIRGLLAAATGGSQGAAQGGSQAKAEGGSQAVTGSTYQHTSSHSSNASSHSNASSRG